MKSGKSCWLRTLGDASEYGSNIGELDFEVPICDGKVVYISEPMRGDQRYKLQLTFKYDRLIAEEHLVVGYFGLNASLAGEYVRVE